MNQSYEWFSKKHREGLFSAISAGFFFLLVGVIFITTPNLFDRIMDFFREWARNIIRVPNTEILLPAPTRTHPVVYIAVEKFSYVWGVFQVAMLGFRLAIGSPWNKNAETASKIVFWIGTGFLIRKWLIETTGYTATTNWFVFWSAIIILLGATLIVRAIILAAAYARR